MDWDKLRIFHAVAKAGSFTRAGEHLSLSQSAVSRQIGALEEDLNVSLFHRHARGLILTEQGEALFETVHDVSSRLVMAEAIIGEQRDKPTGELRITTTVGFGSLWLTPRIGAFLDIYPEITITMLVDDRELDLSMREADVGIRMRASTQPDLVQRKLFRINHHLYAAPSYLQRFGVPQKLADLDRNQRLVVWGANVPAPVSEVNWLLHMDAGPVGVRKSVLRVNSTYGLLHAVENGAGIASLPDYLARPLLESGRIARVLPTLDGPANDAYFVYPEELRNSKRIAAFRDFILDQVSHAEF